MLPLYTNDELRGLEREKIFRRAQNDMDNKTSEVQAWIGAIRQKGDQALQDYIRQFDAPSFRMDRLRVSRKDIQEAYKKIDKGVLGMIRKQIKLAKTFHQEQARRIFAGEWEIEATPGVRTGVKISSLDSVGLYVPAGKAPLPTVAQILTVAAKAAKVPRICVCFPPRGDFPEIIVAAHEAGADEIYRMGGIGAIAAMAYGTESVKPVEKIVGPGSPWVQAAKLQVFGQVGIDMLSGPSEALILADETAKASWVAADILARCEHGPDSTGLVVTNAASLAEKIQIQVRVQKQKLSRQSIIDQALTNGYNGIVLVKTRQEMIDFANEYGAEHLHLQVKDAEKMLPFIRHAGSIFVGPYAPVPVGDYASGTNHCLPTSRAVKFASPVGVETFVKTNEYQILSRRGLQALQPLVQTISRVEGLDGHENAVNIRCS